VNFFQPASAPSDVGHLQPQNITPSDSDSEDAAAHYPDGQQQQQHLSAFGQGWGEQPIIEPPSLPSVVEASDMDMDDAMELAEPIPQRPHPQSPDHLAPGAFQPDAIATSITSRMPTPIQPSFAAQVRGNNWGGAAGNVMRTETHPMMSATRPLQQQLHHPFGLAGLAAGELAGMSDFRDQSVPRSLDQAAMHGWNEPRTRSLPSPISESGGEDMGSPDMVLDGMQVRSNSLDIGVQNPHPLVSRSHSALSLPHLAADGPITDSALTESPVAQVGSSPVAVAAAASAAAMETDPPATPSPKKGHSRSRHTLNSWTQQPGMKKSFSIGYRADCEKCRNKVPGHFNHIIVS